MQQNFLLLLTSLEARTSHPLASDVLRVARINHVEPTEISGFQEFAGRGLGGLIQLPHEARPRAVVLGSREFIAECGLQIPDILEVTARQWESQAGSVIALGGWDGWIRGVVHWSLNTIPAA